LSATEVAPSISDAPAAVAEISLIPLKLTGELTLPEPARPSIKPSFFRRHALFIVSVVVPVFATAFYLFVIASDRFASEASFVIRSTSGNSEVESVSALVQTKGTSRAADETYAVNEYLTSRDVLKLLAANDHLLEILNRPGADFVNKFPNFWSRKNGEQLYRRFQSMVRSEIDDTTGISTLEVTAFRPEDAHAIALALLSYAEMIVNRMNDRAYQDALTTANRFVDLAMKEVEDAEKQLSDYRNASGMVDPNSESDSTLKIIESLSIELAKTEATISQQMALAPNSPGITALREQARSYRDAISQRKLEIAGANASAASKLAKFEELILQRELAAKSLENAVASRDHARQDASEQHLYVQTIRSPNIPDIAKYPRSLLYLFSTSVVCILVFSVLRALRGISLEHRP
jgi:capsular polysaccharide transport system permease protein